MITVDLYDDMFVKAKHKSDLVGALNHSILAGQGNLVGFLGEIIAHQYIGGEVADSFDYDIIRDGIRYDVKSKKTNVVPKMNYECSVAAYQQNQDCDRYIFTRINPTQKTGWLLGWIDKDDFFENSVLIKKGETDSFGWVAVETCYNMKVNQLKPMELLCFT